MIWSYFYFLQQIVGQFQLNQNHVIVQIRQPNLQSDYKYCLHQHFSSLIYKKNSLGSANTNQEINEPRFSNKRGLKKNLTYIFLQFDELYLTIYKSLRKKLLKFCFAGALLISWFYLSAFQYVVIFNGDFHTNSSFKYCRILFSDHISYSFS